jgi:spore coat polysaccharide biosynthesis protein SpsF (cytidylyltransferase family)
MNEKLLSAILELKTTIEHAPEVLQAVRAIAPTLNTIITIGAATRCDAKGDNKLEALFMREGYNVFRGKTNAGLGRRSATPAV